MGRTLVLQELGRVVRDTYTLYMNIAFLLSYLSSLLNLRFEGFRLPSLLGMS